MGDIHGCLAELVELERRVRAASAREGASTLIVSLGDLVDRGPDSAGVIGHFRRGAAEGTHAAILGNHEELMLRALHDHAPWSFERVEMSQHVSVGALYRSLRPAVAEVLTPEDFRALGRLTWITQGGARALASWSADPRDPSTWRLPEEDVAFLCSLPVVHRSPGVVATHALVRKEELAELESDETPRARRAELVQRALWMRRLPPGPVDAGIHVSGHTPMKRPRRYPARQLLRLDTGCCYGNRLSAWCPELDRVVSVKSARS
ncbi:MAG: metallophosphoesterase [Myxococcales bacterium]|nr:metallophosphoesterase [Myxococcales bacterium]MCB9671878.1 metallophosphoesterase [Alphaproteobacteria bacterium]MCB9693850.1 metallophosphoesterase [Alphaproteobacteria bacterium]